uniref:Uncharacterized protein n=1 Tax=Glossina austeni TaxID=7395 RepID=A0A1A9UM46_GLOAU
MKDEVDIGVTVAMAVSAIHRDVIPLYSNDSWIIYSFSSLTPQLRITIKPYPSQSANQDRKRHITSYYVNFPNDKKQRRYFTTRSIILTISASSAWECRKGVRQYWLNNEVYHIHMYLFFALLFYICIIFDLYWTDVLNLMLTFAYNVPVANKC